MAVIHLPVRRARTLEPIHRTTPRVGIFVQAQRARATGPQAHQHTYIADERRVEDMKLRDALARFAVILLGLYCGLGLGRAAWDFVRGFL